MNKATWKVGKLARRTGLTIRTLHHYDRIGLLSPSQHTDSGHRLYTKTDIAKLQQVLSLKQLGFALEEIKELMENASLNAGEVIGMQLESLKEHIQRLEELYSKLESIYLFFGAKQEVSAEHFFKVIEIMKMNESKHFTAEQIQQVKKRYEQIDSAELKEMEKEWSIFITKLRTEMEKGTPPDDPEVVSLAEYWRESFAKSQAVILKLSDRQKAIIKIIQIRHSKVEWMVLFMSISKKRYRIDRALSNSSDYIGWFS